jgi:hypothetical protein
MGIASWREETSMNNSQAERERRGKKGGERRVRGGGERRGEGREKDTRIKM